MTKSEIFLEGLNLLLTKTYHTYWDYQVNNQTEWVGIDLQIPSDCTDKECLDASEHVHFNERK